MAVDASEVCRVAHDSWLDSGKSGARCFKGLSSPTMNKLSAGATFLLCLFLGIIFDQVAIGIIAGLILGAGAGKVTAPKSDTEA